MPFIRVYLHFVWSTKKRTPFLCSSEIRKNVWTHINLYAQSKGIYCLDVSGYSDHCHSLIALQKDQNLVKVVQLLKGESSHWINQQGLILDRFSKGGFAWQEDYFCESISPDKIDIVKHYLSNQENHHKVVSFEQEYQSFLEEFSEEDLHLG